jgi:hypothetical protein
MLNLYMLRLAIQRFFKTLADNPVGATRKFMDSPQGWPIFLASPKIEGEICLSLEMLKCGTSLYIYAFETYQPSNYAQC